MKKNRRKRRSKMERTYRVEYEDIPIEVALRDQHDEGDTFKKRGWFDWVNPY